MRSYNLAYCVVTPTGYLHEFKDHDVSPSPNHPPGSTQTNTTKKKDTKQGPQPRDLSLPPRLRRQSHQGWQIPDFWQGRWLGPQGPLPKTRLFVQGKQHGRGRKVVRGHHQRRRRNKQDGISHLHYLCGQLRRLHPRLPHQISHRRRGHSPPPRLRSRVSGERCGACGGCGNCRSTRKVGLGYRLGREAVGKAGGV